jgi:hypothetical protein
VLLPLLLLEWLLLRMWSQDAASQSAVAVVAGVTLAGLQPQQ